MVKIERSFPAPASLQAEAKKISGSYEKSDVIAQLKKDFHNKCYICELKDLLRRESAFAAFKRNYIKDNSKEFPKLMSYIE